MKIAVTGKEGAGKTSGTGNHTRNGSATDEIRQIKEIFDAMSL